MRAVPIVWCVILCVCHVSTLCRTVCVSCMFSSSNWFVFSSGSFGTSVVSLDSGVCGRGTAVESVLLCEYREAGATRSLLLMLSMIWLAGIGMSVIRMTITWTLFMHILNFVCYCLQLVLFVVRHAESIYFVCLQICSSDSHDLDSPDISFVWFQHHHKFPVCAMAFRLPTYLPDLIADEQLCVAHCQCIYHFKSRIG